MSEEEEKMESLEQLLVRTIKEGAPLYNKGEKQKCYDLYFDAAKYACMQEKLSKSAVGQLLEQATDEAMALGSAGDFDEGAWVLRRCFDQILEQGRSDKPGVPRQRSAIRLLETAGEDDDEDSSGYWQDEAAQNTTDEEKAQHLADIYTILVSSISPGSHTRYTRKYDNCFEATLVVETLVKLGLAGHRKTAAQKANLLHVAGLLKSVSHESESSFVDGTHLYRFPTVVEMQEKVEELSKDMPAEGSDATVCLLALKTVVEAPMDLEQDGEKKAMKPLPLSLSMATSPERAEGIQLAAWTAQLQAAVEVKDRTHNFKSYPSCFVGSDAVTAVVEKKLFGGSATTRPSAVAVLNKILRCGLVHHVVREHEIEDKKLFYRFTSPKELNASLETAKSLSQQHPRGDELVRYCCLMERLKQFTCLDVKDILNSFYGCGKDGDQDCWDVVDLQTWRNNMKRWGFGRRSDQDDEMVDKLSLLVTDIDPETWTAPSEEWWGPWGILAQIAIFDQVPRSAFRGTSDAFKWDELAIKATRVAIERGYFETAYKSTLNQFVVLLPLEHSESWEDQKLGVNLLLQLLSTVAIQDEGLSDYEIVKRLEFSKRLTTAFLEHAQVIAKFKRYPHRNKAHHRTTTLEERIWLASDLVPRWAKSQQHAETTGESQPKPRNNIIQLPVIPLRRFTKG